MTNIIDTTPGFLISTKLAAGVAIIALLALGTFISPASADGRRDDHRGVATHSDRGDRGRGGWGGGSYYRAPPVVYGSPYYAPYYAPPPVIYGPSVGIALPGIHIGIR
jgi:hypothetical protein